MRLKQYLLVKRAYLAPMTDLNEKGYFWDGGSKLDPKTRFADTEGLKQLEEDLIARGKLTNGVRVKGVDPKKVYFDEAGNVMKKSLGKPMATFGALGGIPLGYTTGDILAGSLGFDTDSATARALRMGGALAGGVGLGVGGYYLGGGKQLGKGRDVYQAMLGVPVTKP